MPELPEVETVRRRIDRRVRGARILAVESGWKKLVLPDFEQFRGGVCQRAITTTGRRGKRLLLFLQGGPVLGVQLGMSGNLLWQKQTPPQHRHLRARLRLSRGWLLFFDARKFGRLIFFPAADQALAGLGPDALEAAARAGELAAAARRHRKPIKPLLLDQAFLAGVGNIYADEALFRAGIHPARRSDTLSRSRLENLFGQVTAVLREAIRHQGTSFDWVWRRGRMQNRLQTYGRAGHGCLCCGSVLRRIRLQGRSAHFCPRCQK